jgi:uncharacterized protein DUF4124
VRFPILLALACVLAAAPCANADVYTFVDAKGRLNVSNIEPPDDARVTSVVRAKPARAPDSADEARAAAEEARRAAEVARLARRVQELEDQIDAERRASSAPPPPPVVYPVFAPAPVNVTAQAIVEYTPPSFPAMNYGCDPSWLGCSLWWSAPVVFIGSAPRHSRPMNAFNDRRGHVAPFNRGFMTRPPPLFPPSLRATPP